MSDAIFPRLPGELIGVSKSWRWVTRVQTSVSQREIRTALASAPVVRFGLQFEFLRQRPGFVELETLEAFFNARAGRFDSFLFVCPNDSSIVNQAFGTGDGSTRSFQLVRTRGGHTLPVANVAALRVGTAPEPLMWDEQPADMMWPRASSPLMWTQNSSGASGYTLSPTGLLTFNVAPPAGATLYWSGLYYYRCRFDADTCDFRRICADVWECQRADFLGTLGAKL